MPGALRYNRKAIIYILLILSVFCYFVFYDNSASAQSFRTSTEAGLARARGQKTHHDTKTPLQENLSDEDQTKKANEKLQSILESTKNRENAKSSGEELKEKISDKLGNLPGTEKLQHDVEDISVAGRKKMPNPNSPKATDEKESIMKTDAKTDVKTKDKAEEKDTTEEVDPAKDFAREKLMEYLKNPGKSIYLVAFIHILLRILILPSCYLLEINMPTQQTRQAPTPRDLLYHPQTTRRRARPS